MKKFIPIILSILFLIFALVYAETTTDGLEEEYTQLQMELEEAKAELTIKQNSVHTNSQQAINTVTGLDEERRIRDNDYIGGFLDNVLTWHSYDEYCQQRDYILETYNPDQAFMDMFFPDIPCKISPNGKNYNRIDTRNLTMEYVAIDSYIIDISHDNYRYFTKVTVKSVSNGGESFTNLVIEYTIDADGNVLDIKGIL